MVSCIKLYEVLGVDPDASKKEIRSAYLIRAKLHHPDKSTDDDTAAFIAVKHAYDVLSNETKRKRYDRTGQTGYEDDFDFAAEYYEQRVTMDDIASYEKRYIGGMDEIEDLIRFVQKFEGDVAMLFDCIPFSHPEHIDRYEKILLDLVHRAPDAEGCDIRPFAQTLEKSLKKLKKKVPSLKRKFKKEAELVDEAIEASGGMDELIAKIQGKQNRRLAALDDLENRYVKGSPKKATRKKSLKTKKGV